MLDIFSKINLKQYKLLAVMCRILGDLFSAAYVMAELKKEKIVVLYIKQSLSLQNIDMESLDPNMIEAMKSVVINTFAATLVFLMIFHLIIYYRYFKEKPFAKKYVVFMSWFGLVLTSWAVIEGLKDFEWLQLLNIFSLPLFLFVIVGHKKFFPKTSAP